MQGIFMYFLEQDLFSLLAKISELESLLTNDWM